MSSKLPNEIDKNENFMVSYSLKKSIRPKLFNHKSFIKNLDVDAILENENVFLIFANLLD